MIVYEFLYCDCIHESSFATISLHRTKKGAYKAMRDYIEDSYNKWIYFRYMFGKKRDKGCKWGVHEAWKIGEIKVLD